MSTKELVVKDGLTLLVLVWLVGLIKLALWIPIELLSIVGLVASVAAAVLSIYVVWKVIRVDENHK